MSPLQNPITAALADFACSLTFKALPNAVVDKLKQLVLDNLACTVGGASTPVAHPVLTYARLMGGEQRCVVPGTSLRTSPALAAFCWATLANAQDYDDTGSRGHPGASLVPAVLSLGQWLNSSGENVLTALAVGYEVNDRVARGTLPSPDRYNAIHANGSLQGVGVAAACASLLGLNHAQTLDCLGIAAVMAPVPHASKFGWDDKSICSVKDNVALPAENGIRAALLAREGYLGSESVMDGPGGFWAMLGSDRCLPEVLMDFSEWRVTGVSLKPYPCCRWVHTALDALEGLRQHTALTPCTLHELTVFTTPSIAARFGRKQGVTFLDAQFSTPLALAMHLHQLPRVEWYKAEAWNNEAVLRTAACIRVEGDEALMQHFVETGRQSSRVPARLLLRMIDGTTHDAYCDMASGSPDVPLSATQCESKWRELLQSQCTADEISQLFEYVHTLDKAPALDCVYPLLAKAE